ncbi:MAG: Maf family protein [Spirochaetes bacterium]|nr:Maf family protein [Spirochaetota bacterium]
MEEIVLASQSQARQEGFRLLGLPFSVVPAMIDESLPPNADPETAAGILAVKKAEKVAKRQGDDGEPPKWVFAADTIIALAGEIFGKPADRGEALQMLSRLSGKTHLAVTAIALYNGRLGRVDCRRAKCEVSFAELSPAEIGWYLDTGEWRGAAAGYRIQGAGAGLILSVKGCIGAVAGLPLRDFCVMLKDNGYPYGC